MERKIFVYENFSSPEPKKLGVLYVDTLRGTEHYSFEYDEYWLKNTKFLIIWTRIFQCSAEGNIQQKTFSVCLRTHLPTLGASSYETP